MNRTRSSAFEATRSRTYAAQAMLLKTQWWFAGTQSGPVEQPGLRCSLHVVAALRDKIHSSENFLVTDMVGYGPDGLYWGHAKPNYRHEHSGPNSCWNWEVQKMLSRRCTSEVNAFIQPDRSEAAEEKMVLCFVRNASQTHNACTRDLKVFDSGKSSLESLQKCAQKEFGLAMRNLIQTAIAVGECRPVE
jgi:hypothetical protein